MELKRFALLFVSVWRLFSCFRGGVHALLVAPKIFQEGE